MSRYHLQYRPLRITCRSDDGGLSLPQSRRDPRRDRGRKRLARPGTDDPRDPDNQASDRLAACAAWNHLDHSGRVHLAWSTRYALLRDAPFCLLRELPARISMNRLVYSLTVHSTLSTIAAWPFPSSGRKSDRCSYVCQGDRMTFRWPPFWGCGVGVRTGLSLVCGQDRDGPLQVERASSY
jgi:hypothetical protein